MDGGDVMGQVAVVHCPICATIEHRQLPTGDSVSLVSPCACGGRRSVVRVFSDRRRRDIPVAVDRRGFEPQVSAG